MVFNSCLWWGKMTAKYSYKVLLEEKAKCCSLLLPCGHRWCRRPGKRKLSHPRFLGTPATLSFIRSQFLLRLAHQGCITGAHPGCRAEKGGKESWVINVCLTAGQALSCLCMLTLALPKALIQAVLNSSDFNLNNTDHFFTLLDLEAFWNAFRKERIIDLIGTRRTWEASIPLNSKRQWMEAGIPCDSLQMCLQENDLITFWSSPPGLGAEGCSSVPPP